MVVPVYTPSLPYNIVSFLLATRQQGPCLVFFFTLPFGYTLDLPFIQSNLFYTTPISATNHINEETKAVMHCPRGVCQNCLWVDRQHRSQQATEE